MRALLGFVISIASSLISKLTAEGVGLALAKEFVEALQAVIGFAQKFQKGQHVTKADAQKVKQEFDEAMDAFIATLPES